jgi:hypothetical protein
VLFPGWTEVKVRLDAGVKTLIWSAIATGAAVVAIGLLCAALFIWIDGLFGAIWACLALGGVFLLVVCIATVAIVSIRRRQARMLAVRKQSAATIFRDPAVLTLALQVGRTLGLKRAIPLGLLAAFLVGIVLSRPASRDGAASKADSDD